jgi:Ca-activated chloride channel family protein
MKCKTNLFKSYLILITLVFYNANAASSTSTDKTQSPYFIVLTDENDVASFPLKSTTTKVHISGVMADVNVKQAYTNTGQEPIEAIYVFPASTRAAVYDMVMKVNNRNIRAVIKEKKKARDLYEKAKKEGKTSSLLAQERPNVFTMRVANILPGSTVEVDLSYTEILVPTNNTYEFVYPTVVGPRYASKEEIVNNSAESWVANPFTRKGIKPISSFSIQVELSSSLPIQSIRCETHSCKPKFITKQQAQLKLLNSDEGNRDFVLQYRLAGKTIETGILTYKDPSGENYFLAMIQPPERVKAEHITAREYVFIMDVSGSMEGFPLEISKQLIHDILINLKEQDLFNIVFFAGGSEVYSQESLEATEENISGAINYLKNCRGSGGTQLLDALKSATQLGSVENHARTFVILTDGFVSVEKEAFDYIRQHLGQANFFTFGIGSSVNRFLIEGLAHVGCGESFIALNKQEAKALAPKFINYISSPILTNIKYDFHNIETYDLYPANIPDMFADRPLIITGKYKETAGGSLTIKGIAGNNNFSKTTSINTLHKTNEQAIKYFWVREKIRLLADYNRIDHNKESENEIIELSKKYNILTEFTSFIATDSVLVNPGGNQTSIKQPIPLPLGVSNLAIDNETFDISDFDVLEECLEIVDDEECDEEQAVFSMIEQMPEYPGGEKALQAYLNNHIQYPEEAKENGIQGRVYVSFVVDTDGSITNVKIIRGVDPLLDAEAIRVIKAMPKWLPGKQRGKAVRASYTIPISFKMDPKNSNESSI